jgi:hypothetical protein
VVKTQAFCLKIEKELVTEASCLCYKKWTVDFFKVTKNKGCFYLEEQMWFQSMSNLQTCFIAASFLETEYYD